MKELKVEYLLRCCQDHPISKENQKEKKGGSNQATQAEEKQSER